MSKLIENLICLLILLFYVGNNLKYDLIVTPPDAYFKVSNFFVFDIID